MSLICDGVFAVTESVPQLDCSIAGTGDDLTVVSGEGHGKDIVGVSNETTSGGTGRELPETESLIP